MRIGISIVPALPSIGGGWQYAERLLAALAAHDHDDEYVVAATPASAELVPRQANFQCRLVPVPAWPRMARVAREYTTVAGMLRGERIDCMHHMFASLPLRNPVPTVVTFYDLIAIGRPQDFSAPKRAYLRWARGHAARHATMLAPISQATADHLHAEFGVPSERMRVVPMAMERAYARRPPAEAAAFRARHGLPEHFWLYVAKPLPHKNHARLIQAFASLRARGSTWGLALLTEPTDELRQLVHASGVGDAIHLLPRLAESEMPLLYSTASGLVFPSLFEGGGLPVMEAMACGCPVVASDIPTSREFGGGATLLFDPHDVRAMSEAMARLEADGPLRARLAAEGPPLVARFSPAAVAAACSDAYRRAVGRPA